MFSMPSLALTLRRLMDPFLSNSWSSSLSSFGEFFAVALDMAKAFDRVWHMSLLSKLPSYGFYAPFCSFISSFLSDRSIFAVVDGHCSVPITINNGVPQGSVFSSTLFLFLLMIFSLLLKTSYMHMPTTPLCIIQLI